MQCKNSSVAFSWTGFGRLLGFAAVMGTPFGLSDAVAQDNAILEEIVVTAQRREENIQDVPISVTAISGERLDVFMQGGEDIRALAARVPSLYAESSNGRLAPRFYMRGLGNSDFDLAASQSVSIIFDEVVQENVILKSFPIFDIGRVEVLRGPQGSLFGRNTPAGIIKFESRKPTEDLDGYVSATIGSLGTKNVEGAIGGSLNESETVLARLSVLSQNREDWIDNGFTGESDAMGGFSENAFRLQLQALPSDSFSALLNFHGRDLSSGTASIFRANVLSPGSNELNQNFDRDLVFFDGGNNNPQEATALGGSLKLDWDFGNDMVLTSISAYETVENRSLGDIDGGVVDFSQSFPVPDPITSTPNFPVFGIPALTFPGTILFPSETQDGLEDLEQITQEFRLASEASDRMFWQAGVFWFDSDFSVQTFPFFVPPTTVRHQNTAWAVFGQVAYDITDNATLTGGVRYTDDEKDMTTPQTPNPQPPVSVSDEQVSWDLSLMYALSDQWNVYGRVASGFRAPSIQGRNIAFFDPNPFSIATSETLLSYELGFKSLLAGDRVRLNGAVYYYTIDDMQLSAIGGNTNSNVLVNADQGIGMGIDLDTEIVLTDNFVVSFGGSWNDTEIDDPNLRTAVCAQCTVLDPIDAQGFALLDGNPFPQAPEHMISATARYSVPVTNDDELYVFADYVQQGDTSFFLYESAEFHTGTIFEVGLRAGYIANDGQWELSVFARNLTDEENLKGGIDFNNLTGFVNEPRIFGINFQMNFGGY